MARKHVTNNSLFGDMQLRSGRIYRPWVKIAETPPPVEDPESSESEPEDDDKNKLCRHCQFVHEDDFPACPMCGREGPYCNDCYRCVFVGLPCVSDPVSFSHHMQHCAHQKSLGSPCSDSDCDMTDDESMSDVELEEDDVLGRQMQEVHRQVKQAIQSWPKLSF